MTEDRLEKVYSADTPEKAEAAYDGWASKYDADLMAMGYRLPWMFAACVLRHIPFGIGPILDAGCGTGLQVEPLHLAGLARVHRRGPFDRDDGGRPGERSL
jgi:predicted TPR repeat methyltransferase